jgi:hypothetical protein
MIQHRPPLRCQLTMKSSRFMSLKFRGPSVGPAEILRIDRCRHPWHFSGVLPGQ